MKSKIQLMQYTEDYGDKWDDFVSNGSVNGTFLQTRNFLNYHKPGIFCDNSLMFFKGTNIVAVLPGHCVTDENERILYSHLGSTFGGLVLGKCANNIADMTEIMDALEEYYNHNNISKVVLKQTSPLYCSTPSALIDYFMYLYGYTSSLEIGYFIDCGCLPDDVISAYKASKRRDFKYSTKNALSFKELVSDNEVRQLYSVLLDNYQKFNTLPVHTIDDWFLFKNDMLTDKVKFYGVLHEGRIIAGSMVFLFDNGVFHTQYLCSLPEAEKLYSNAFLYTYLIREARKLGLPFLSFGTSTLEHGKVLNKELAQFKESFGTDTYCNYTYSKIITR